MPMGLAHAADVLLRFTPHAMALVVVIAAFAGQPSPYAPVGWLFGIAPLIEALLCEERLLQRWPGNADRLARELALWLWPPLQGAVLIVGIYLLRKQPGLAQALSLAIPAGMLAGTFGMAAAHEFMHDPKRGAQVAAAVLLAACGYGHFVVEHVRGHHRRVTMSSISELAWASISGSVLISTDWFGIKRPASFSAASAALASIHAFKTTRDSMSAAGGSGGSSL